MHTETAMWILKTVLIIFIALVASQCCSANTTTPKTQSQSGDEITDNGVPEKSSLEKGMEPFFAMCHGFMKTVMSVDFYDSQESAFGNYLLFFWLAIQVWFTII